MSEFSAQLAAGLAGSLWGHVTGVIILLLMGLFLGIWIWAWRPRHQHTFRRLARMPMEDAQAGSRIPSPAEEKES